MTERESERESVCTYVCQRERACVEQGNARSLAVTDGIMLCEDCHHSSCPSLTKEHSLGEPDLPFEVPQGKTDGLIEQ